MNVNIGGGSAAHEGWLNFDAINGFALTPDTVFPVHDATAPIVYSSHCLEHLNDKTIDRVLAESRRMLAPDGNLVLKLPDYERVIERYEAGDEAFFNQWGIQKLVHMWPAQGVKDSLAARACMIFCGIWNPAYGDANAHFTKQIGTGDDAYHGPIPMEEESYQTILKWKSLRQIAQMMAACKKPDWHFNHQSAWSHVELTYLLEIHGFKVVSQDAEDAEQMPIPDIGVQEAISMYVVARK